MVTDQCRCAAGRPRSAIVGGGSCIAARYRIRNAGKRNRAREAAVAYLLIFAVPTVACWNPHFEVDVRVGAGFDGAGHTAQIKRRRRRAGNG